MRRRNRGKADNGIERRTDFMTYAIEEFLLGTVCGLCCRERLFQSLSLRFELFLLLQLQTSGFIDADKARHDLVLRIRSLTRHHKLELPIFNHTIDNHAVVDIIGALRRKLFTHNFARRHFHEHLAVIGMHKRICNQL